jgi:hypothetical protein
MRGSDGKGSLESETAKYGREYHGDSAPRMISLARASSSCFNDRPVLSSERASHIKQPATVWQKIGRKLQIGVLFQDRLADWPSVVT